MAQAPSGIDTRKAGAGALLFRASLKDSAGVKLTAGTTTLRLYELQSDGTLKTYDFSDNTFKTTAPTTDTLTMTHRQASNNTVNTGLWTIPLTTLTGFTAGGIYAAQVSNSGASPADQEREFQYGGAEGDLVIDVNGQVTTGTIANGAITAASIASNAITAAKIATDAITSAKIQDGALTSGKFADGAFIATKFASDAVAKIQLGLATGADAATIAGYVDTLESSAATIQGALSGLASTDGNIQTALSNLSTAVGTLQSAVNTVQGYTDTLETSNATLLGYTDSVEGGITSLQTTSNTIAGYVDTVEASLAALATAVNNLPNNTVTAIKNDADFKKVLAGSATYDLTLPESFPGTGTMTFKKADGTTLGTAALTFNADKGVTSKNITVI